MNIITIPSGKYFVVTVTEQNARTPDRWMIRSWCYKNCSSDWGFSDPQVGYDKKTHKRVYRSYFAFDSKMDATALKLSFDEVVTENVSWPTRLKFTLITQKEEVV